MRIDGFELSGLELPLTPEYTRMTTVVRLHGASHEGVGEDTTYAAPDQLAVRAGGLDLPLAGDWTIDTFSAHLERLDLFPVGPSTADFVNFRRWAFESAALDLALRQADIPLATALGRVSRPASFVVSPAAADPVRPKLALYPDLRLKLMASPDWDDTSLEDLAATGAVDVVDLKGQYAPELPVAVRPEPALYRRVLRAFPDAWIEDPGETAATTPILDGHRHRITWDAPIRSAADIARRSPPCGMINMKPSRFGSLQAFLDAHDFCERRAIRTYAGGQFELGPGRRQVQLLASLFSPDAPNDVAPTAFNEPVLRPGLPSNRLPACPLTPGFR